jgi:hypothetical protein
MRSTEENVDIPTISNVCSDKTTKIMGGLTFGKLQQVEAANTT